MNCVSIAIYPLESNATLERVIEYFCPNDRQGSRIWVDVFLDNPSRSELTLKIIHAGSLSGADVTEDSWIKDESDTCTSVLTSRIKELHAEFFPIEVKSSKRVVRLGEEEYQAWSGNLKKVIGDDRSKNVPFTLWQLENLKPGRSFFRLCLEMHPLTFQNRIGTQRSFFAYGEAIILRNIENGDIPSYREADAERYKKEFEDFKGAHRAAKAFEYLIVSPEGVQLSWDAVPLSTSISPKFIRSSELAKTTRWFTAENSDSWELQANVIEVIRLDDLQSPQALAGEARFASQEVG